MVSNISYHNTKEFLQESGAFAHQIISPYSTEEQSNSSNTKTVHHHHHSSWGWGGGPWGFYPRPVYYPGSSYASSSSKEEKDYSALTIPLVIGALVTIYPAAQNWAEWSMAEKGMARIQQKMRVVEPEIHCQNRSLYYQQTDSHQTVLRDTVRSIFDQQMTILAHKRSEAKTGFLWKTLLFSSLVAGAGAAWVTAPLIGALSVVVGLTSAGAMIWRSGVRSIDDEVKEEARQLQKTVNYASDVLNNTIRITI